MLPKNYSQNDKNKSGGSDTLGIVLVILFSFLLLCNVTGSLILGDIGLAVQNVSLGLLGYCSYPVFLYCIIRGIFLLQNKNITISVGKSVALVFVFVCAGIILQLATTTGYLGGGFGGYIDSVFRGKTVGGVVLGVFSFAFAAFLTPVGAYILLACAILALLAYVAGFFGKSGASRVRKRKVPSGASARIKGGTSFIGNGQDLFIQSIIPKENGGKYGTMDDLPDERFNTSANGNRDGYGLYDEMNASRYPARENPVTSPEIERMNKIVDERYNQIRERSRDAWGIPEQQNNYQNDDYAKRSSYSSKAWEDYIPSVPPKDVSGRIVNGEIIRGFDYGAPGTVSGGMQNGSGQNNYGYGSGGSNAFNPLFDRDRQSGAQTNGNSIRFSMDEIKQDSYKAMYDSYAPEREKFSPKPDIKIVSPKQEGYFDFPTPAQPVQPEPQETRQRAPIINASEVEPEYPPETNVFVSEPVQAPQETRQRAPIINGSSVMADEPYYRAPEIKSEQAPEPKKDARAPIIRGSRFEEDLQKAEEAKKIEQKKEKAEQKRAKSEQEKTKKESAEVVSFDNAEKSLPLKADKSINEDNVFIDTEDDEVVAPEKTESEKNSDYEEYFEKEEYEDAADSEKEQLGFDDNLRVRGEIINGDEATDDEYDESDDDLSPQEYMERYGSPKFVDVSKSDSDDLSKRFEKTTTSFKIIDEVEDASEHVKRGLDSRDNKSEEDKVAPSEFNLGVITAADKTGKNGTAEQAKEEAPKKPKKPYKYTGPEISLLTTESTIPKFNPELYEEKKTLLESTLSTFGINAIVKGVIVGPTITRYELEMPVGIPVKRIESYDRDICLRLACKGNILIKAPIPGKSAVGIDVPNDENALVALKDIIDSPEFKSSSSPLTIALGKDIQGKVMVTRIDKMPHLLMAGTTGSGKSACLNSLIISLLYKSSPEDVKLILIDPKRVEFTAYSGLPHMMIPDAITEPDQALNAFKWAREEMERRYKLLQSQRVRNISEYNNLEDVKNRTLDKMPYIVVIVDEFADLMISSNADKKKEQLENLISSIAGKARAAGIHLILATQRPSREFITGPIKANLSCRIAFAVSSQTDSRIILDKNGAEALLGKGDMLFAPQESPDGIRIQGAFITNDEVLSIVDQIKANNVCDYDEEFEKALVAKPATEADAEVVDSDDIEGIGYDKDLPTIVRTVITTGQASGSMLQRRFGIGYQRAVKIIDQMEKFGFIGPHNGSKAREVYVTKEKFKEFFGEEFDDD